MTVMGDAGMDVLSDAGSTPAWSMFKRAAEQAAFCFKKVVTAR